MDCTEPAQPPPTAAPAAPFIGAPGERGGFVLLLASFVLLLLSLFAGWLLLAASEEVRIARARSEMLRLRFAAESAVRIAAYEWDAAELIGMQPGQIREVGTPGELPGGVRFSASAQRLAPGSFLIRGVGEISRERFQASSRAGMLVRVVEPEDLLASLPGAVTSAGPLRLTDGVHIAGAAPNVAPPGWPAAFCSGGTGPAVVLAAEGLLQLGEGAVLAGEPPVAFDAELAEPDAFRFGPFTAAELGSMADRVETGSRFPAPAYRNGECDKDRAGNWGSPLDPSGPCGDYFPLIHAPGDLELAGGEGQGVLIVDGDLVIGAGVSFFGAVFVRGRLSAPAGFRLRGALRLLSPDRSGHVAGGSVVFDDCVLQRAVLRIPAFTKAYRHPARSWVPVF